MVAALAAVITGLIGRAAFRACTPNKPIRQKSASLRVVELFDVPLTVDVPPGSRRTDRILRGAGRGVSGATIVAVKEDYFVAEPQGTVFWKLAPWLRIDAGVGYRLIGAAGGLDDRLRGVSGSVSVQLFGGGA